MSNSACVFLQRMREPDIFAIVDKFLRKHICIRTCVYDQELHPLLPSWKKTPPKVPNKLDNKNQRNKQNI